MKKNIIVIVSILFIIGYVTVTSFLWYNCFNGVQKDVDRVSIDDNVKIIDNGPFQGEVFLLDYDKDSSSIKPYNFDLISSTDVSYKLFLKEITLDGIMSLNRSYLHYELRIDDKIVADGNLEDLDDLILNSGRISKGDVMHFSIRLWIRNDCIDKNWIGKYYYYKVYVEGIDND